MFTLLLRFAGPLLRSLSVLVYFASVACASVNKVDLPWPTIPDYDPKSATLDTAGVRVSALVGTVEDSVSGRPLGGAQALLTQIEGNRQYYSYTDESGGFVVARVIPGSYTLQVRNVGYSPYISRYLFRVGTVDTLRARLRPMPK